MHKGASQRDPAEENDLFVCSVCMGYSSYLAAQENPYHLSPQGSPGRLKDRLPLNDPWGFSHLYCQGTLAHPEKEIAMVEGMEHQGERET